MKRIHTLGALVALAILALVISACGTQLITPAQQTAVAATGMAAANGMLSNAPTMTQRASTAVPTAVPFNATLAGPGTATSGVPVTGGTAPAITPTSPVGISTGSPGGNILVPTNAGGANGTSSGSSGSAGSSGATGSSAAIPGTGGTSTTIPSSTSACNTPLNAGAAGPMATLWIKNDSGSPVDFNMGIAGANSFGQCGYLSFGPIKPNQSLRVTVPVTQTNLGDPCYWAYAVLNSQGSQTIVAGQSGGYCITTPQRWVINIHNDRIRLVGP